mmetsp:Transcript_53301/g.95660  ORF Transcript_53301/g.95660 Transcript_53301/m.95660 type:complete len:91 (-) Transcript_53301:75-347(-)
MAAISLLLAQVHNSEGNPTAIADATLMGLRGPGTQQAVLAALRHVSHTATATDAPVAASSIHWTDSGLQDESNKRQIARGAGEHGPIDAC